MAGSAQSGSSRPGSTDSHANSHSRWTNERGPLTWAATLARWRLTTAQARATRQSSSGSSGTARGRSSGCRGDFGSSGPGRHLCATTEYLPNVGIRELKPHASKVVARAAAGEIVTVTDRGRPVARLVSIACGRLRELRVSGALRTPTRLLAELGPPCERAGDGPSLTELLLAMRDQERS